MATATNDNDGMIQTLRQTLKSLDVRKQALEMEAEAITSELTTPPKPGVEPMGIDTPLVDNEGYPRGDIDLYRAKTIRGRLACIQTDHQALMKDIERQLLQLNALASTNNLEENEQNEEQAKRTAPKPKPKYDPSTGKWVVKNWDGTVAGIPGGDKKSFDGMADGTDAAIAEAAAAAAGGGGTAAASTSTSATSVTIEEVDDDSTNLLRPFARVDSVADNSPANDAGLQVDDLIVKFDTICVSTQNDINPMKSVGELVPTVAANQQSVTVVVQRKNQQQQGITTKSIQLSPKPWGGRGLLGCHIVPC